MTFICANFHVRIVGLASQLGDYGGAPARRDVGVKPLDIFKEVPGHFQAMFVATKPDIFVKTCQASPNVIFPNP